MLSCANEQNHSVLIFYHKKIYIAIAFEEKVKKAVSNTAFAVIETAYDNYDNYVLSVERRSGHFELKFASAPCVLEDGNEGVFAFNEKIHDIGVAVYSVRSPI